MNSRTLLQSVVLAGLVSACATSDFKTTHNHCGSNIPDPPAPTDDAKDECPGNPDVVFSAVFDEGKPVGIGGGTPEGNNKNNKTVKKGQTICWVATDDQGAPLDVGFDIIFSPTKKPNVPANKNYQTIKVKPPEGDDWPAGMAFKYTVWTGSGDCEFYDPRILIDD